MIRLLLLSKSHRKYTQLSFLNEYNQSLSEPERFWSKKLDLVDWYKRPTQILDKNNPPFYKWYLNGELNASYNCVDRHVKNGLGNRVAIIHDSPVTNSITKLTYSQLLDDVSRFASVLSTNGVKKGDRVLIYMPMIPQAIVAMLASVRLGAIHSLVFGGFASKELSTRINHAKPRVVVSANTGVEPGKLIDYKCLLDKAIEMSDHRPEKCIYFNRPMFPRIKTNSRDTLDYTDELDKARTHDCVPVDSNHPLYLLYTSGTTGFPKAVVRSTASYLISLKYSMSAFYGIKDGDTWWASSDLGWTVGHSYGCYGPLASGATSVLYEGKPVGTPDAGAYFRVLSQHKVVSMFVAPTAIRAIRQADANGDLAKNYDLSSLKYMFVAGERCDHETMQWIKGITRKPTFDHWWQTETGWPITSTCVGLLSQDEIKQVPEGVSGKPVPGYDVRIFKNDGKEAKANELGRILIRNPLPPGTIETLWENDDLFETLYFKKYPGYYDTMDVGYKTPEGYVSVLSRADDVINVAGHRLSCAAIEEAILEHPHLADCAVVSISDNLKGELPFAFVVLIQDSNKSHDVLVNELVENVRSSIGPVACFKHAVIVKKLPKTRSGKIARNCLKAMLNNQEYKIPVTIDDDTVFAHIKQVLQENGFENISDPKI